MFRSEWALRSCHLLIDDLRENSQEGGKPQWAVG